MLIYREKVLNKSTIRKFIDRSYQSKMLVFEKYSRKIPDDFVLRIKIVDDYVLQAREKASHHYNLNEYELANQYLTFAEEIERNYIKTAIDEDFDNIIIRLTI